MGFRIGIDLGGTKLGIGIVDEAGILDCMVRNVDQALAKLGGGRAQIIGVGVTYPGHVRWPEGITLTTSNLACLKNFPLKDALRERLGCPVVVDNDANAQALGEHRFGAGQGCRHMV